MTGAEQSEVRWPFRVLGATMMVLIAALMAAISIPLFTAEKITFKHCAVERRTGSRWLCHVGNEVLTMLPTKLQGPAEGVMHLVVAALLLYFSWLLIKPLLGRSRARSA